MQFVLKATDDLLVKPPFYRGLTEEYYSCSKFGVKPQLP